MRYQLRPASKGYAQSTFESKPVLPWREMVAGRESKHRNYGPSLKGSYDPLINELPVQIKGGFNHNCIAVSNAADADMGQDVNVHVLNGSGPTLPLDLLQAMHRWRMGPLSIGCYAYELLKGYPTVVQYHQLLAKPLVAVKSPTVLKIEQTAVPQLPRNLRSRRAATASHSWQRPFHDNLEPLWSYGDNLNTFWFQCVVVQFHDFNKAFTRIYLNNGHRLPLSGHSPDSVEVELRLTANGSVQQAGSPSPLSPITIFLRKMEQARAKAGIV